MQIFTAFIFVFSQTLKTDKAFEQMSLEHKCKVHIYRLVFFDIFAVR